MNKQQQSPEATNALTLNPLFVEQEKKNREKYGSREDDFIARTFRDDVITGHIWCAQNIKKYLTRFTSKSSKALNLIDLLKCADYLNRMIEIVQADEASIKEEVVDKVKS